MWATKDLTFLHDTMERLEFSIRLSLSSEYEGCVRVIIGNGFFDFLLCAGYV